MSHDHRVQRKAGVHTAVVKTLTRVFSGFLSVDEAIVRHSRYDGGEQEVVRQSIERGKSVAIILVDRRRRVVHLVEQFRFPTLADGPGWVREIPAGDIEPRETAEDAARRETLEETGFTLDVVEHVATFYSSPGASSERISMFFADTAGAPRDLQTALARRDAGEDLALLELPLDTFLADCAAGRVDDAKTLIAGLWLLAHRQRLGLL